MMRTHLTLLVLFAAPVGLVLALVFSGPAAEITDPATQADGPSALLQAAQVMNQAESEDARVHAALSPEQQYEIGLRHFNEGKSDLALQHLDLALAARSDRRYYAARSSVHFGLENFTEALSDIQAAVQLDPEDPGLLSNRGQLLLKFGREAEAQADFNAALKLQPAHVPSLFNRGVLLFQRGENSAALLDFNAAVAAEPGFPNLWFNRAMVQEAQGEMEMAIADMTRFLKLTPVGDHQDLAHELIRRWRENQE